MSRFETVRSMSKARKKNAKIVIDEENGLVFSNETELFNYFKNEINSLEEEFFSLRNENTDIPEENLVDYEGNLQPLMDDPDEIWIDEETIPGVKLTIYMREFEPPSEDEDLFHVAVAYMTDNVPSFVYLHFPTNNIDLVYKYQRGKIIYDRILHNAPKGAIEGDALLEGDELAYGLYDAMTTLRSESDIKEEDFRDYADLREVAIEEADEIWRRNDNMGNILVTFVRDFPDEGHENLWYVVVTKEDSPSNSHALLFSFPTTDKTLVDRYRQGENLHAEEVVQEASH